MAKTTRAPNAKDLAVEASDERLNKAILSFAHGVNNSFEEVIRALQKDDQNELVDDLTELHHEWVEASNAAFDSFQR